MIANLDSNRSYFHETMEIMQKYIAIVEQGLAERIKLLEVSPYDPLEFEVIGGLLYRQATLTIKLADTPSIWNPHIAPLILRTMIDAHITLSWILLNPHERAKEYVKHGIGQEKLLLEHLKKKAEETEVRHTRLSNSIEELEDIINRQRYEFLVEVDIGQIFGVDTRKMAEQANCLELYRLGYTPNSISAHNRWGHIYRYNLKVCKNPLHNYHRIPTMVIHEFDIEFPLRTSDLMSRTFLEIDKFYDLNIDVELPFSWLLLEINKLAENETKEDSNN